MLITVGAQPVEDKDPSGYSLRKMTGHLLHVDLENTLHTVQILVLESILNIYHLNGYDTILVKSKSHVSYDYLSQKAEQTLRNNNKF